ncbi:MAG: hypothetical protein Q8N13_10570 [Acidovorax sp.]|nr:hypothetical protein [Acidovorax sp.]
MTTVFLPDAGFNKPDTPTTPPTSVGGSGHMPAQEINELANDPRELTATVTARGALIPVLYGRRDVPGLVFAYGKSGTSLVIGYIWCVGEVDAVEAVYLNDAAVPVGVTVTSYLGTPTQGVDAALAAAVAAYADTLRIDVPGGGKLGLCYSVVTIAPGKLSGFPRARAVIRGRKVLDPRTGTTGYSANPALMLGDLITNPVFGIGRPVAGVAECANWCDSELGMVPGAFRARAAIYIASGRPAEQYVDLLCEYAECLRVYEGSTIKLVPDAPVDLTTAPIVGPADIVANSFSLSAESTMDTPTEVELQYTQPPVVAEQSWALAPVVVRLPGVTEGEVQRVPTSITLDGVYRYVEAANKAQARLNRMQGRMTASWTTLDMGVTHQRGDVVKVQLPARGIDVPVRIESVNMASYGRYAVSASRYDPSHYPSDTVLPGGDGFVPLGAIAMLVGTEVPAGWALFSDADGCYIVGAGGALAVGATGGSNTVDAFVANSSAGGAHTGSLDMSAIASGPTAGSALPPTHFPVADHTHTVSLAAKALDMLRRDNVLIIKTGGADTELPAAVRVFGLHNTNTTADKITAFAGRLLRAAAASVDAGASTTSASATTNLIPHHAHFAGSNLANIDVAVFGPTPKVMGNVESGRHTHTVTAVYTPRPKRQQVCAFGSATPYSVRAGMVFMWSGSVLALPDDYVLCDGASGTPDLRDRFVEFAATLPAAPAGDNTVSVAMSFSHEGHSHYGGTYTTPAKTVYGHAETIFHTHSASAVQAFTPAYYALAFIMYAPAG